MSDVGPPLDEDLGRLLAEEGTRNEVSPEALDRARARLALSVLGMGLVAGGAAGMAHHAGAGAVRHGITLSALKLGAVVATAFGCGLGAGLLTARAPAPTTASAAPHAGAASLPPEAPVGSTPASSAPASATNDPPHEPPAAPKVRVQPAPVSSEQRASERTLLDQARRSLREGDADRALAMVQRHEKDFPSASLAEERDVIRISTLVALGKAEEARARAAAFDRRYPGSPFAAAVASQLRALDRRDD